MTNSSPRLSKSLIGSLLCFRGEDGFAQLRSRVLLIVDGLQLHIRRDASFEGHAVPPNYQGRYESGLVISAFSEKPSEVAKLAPRDAVRFLQPLRFVIVVHQSIAALRECRSPERSG